jgi:hypothetical protein
LNRPSLAEAVAKHAAESLPQPDKLSAMENAASKKLRSRECTTRISIAHRHKVKRAACCYKHDVLRDGVGQSFVTAL